MEPINKTFTLEMPELEAYFRELQERQSIPNRLHFKAVAFGLTISLVTVGVIHLALPEGVPLSGWVGWTLMILALSWYSVRHSLRTTAYRWAFRKSKEQTPRKVLIGSDAIEIEGPGVFSRIEWSAVKTCSFREAYLLAWLSSDHGVIFPRHGFGEDWDRVAQLFKEKCTSA